MYHRSIVHISLVGLIFFIVIFISRALHSEWMHPSNTSIDRSMEWFVSVFFLLSRAFHVDSLISNFRGFLIWIACGAISLVRNLHFTMFAPHFREAHQIGCLFCIQPPCNLHINLMHLPELFCTISFRFELLFAFALSFVTFVLQICGFLRKLFEVVPFYQMHSELKVDSDFFFLEWNLDNSRQFFSSV